MCVTSSIQDRCGIVRRVNNCIYCDGAPLVTFNVVETLIRLGTAIDGMT